MKATIANAKQIVKKAGGVLEEDYRLRDMRIFQAVAPEGFYWSATGGHHIVMEWSTHPTDKAGDLAWNQTAFDNLVSDISGGAYEPDAEERELQGDY